MTASPSRYCLLLAVACGYHDTPVATYTEPLPDSAGGGAAGSVGAAGDAGVAGAAGEAGAAGDAGAPAAPPCLQTYPTIPDGLTSRYKIVTTGQPWVVAERDCESEGAHLIVINDDVENTWMASIAAQALTGNKSSNQLAWLGFGDQVTEGAFQWVTGAPLGLTHWAANEPNSLNGLEDCGEIRATGDWNDDRCNAKLTYVCECDGLPSAATWCDTDLPTSCGDCSTSCAANQSCTQQQCM